MGRSVSRSEVAPWKVVAVRATQLSLSGAAVGPGGGDAGAAPIASGPVAFASAEDRATQVAIAEPSDAPGDMSAMAQAGKGRVAEEGMTEEPTGVAWSDVASPPAAAGTLAGGSAFGSTETQAMPPPPHACGAHGGRGGQERRPVAAGGGNKSEGGSSSIRGAFVQCLHGGATTGTTGVARGAVLVPLSDGG